MAQFDLKNATVWIRDGYTGPTGIGSGAVNNVSGYPIGAVTMLVDGFTGPVVTGDVFTVAGDTNVNHRITAHIETLTATTSITFTPALAGAVTDGAAITFMPHELEVELGEGNCTYNQKRPMEYKKSRGKLSKVRLGDEDPVEVKIDCIWEFLRSPTGAATPTIEEALLGVGAASTWVSAGADPCEPYAVVVDIQYEPPCAGVQKEKISFPEFRQEQIDHDAKAGTLSVTAKCNVTMPTITRYT